MDSPGRSPVTIDLSTAGSESTLKDKPFKIKEGAKFTMSATFRVQHEILSGLHYVQIVKRKGVRVSKDSEMIVSLAPRPACAILWRICERDIEILTNCRALTLPTLTSSLCIPRSVSRQFRPLTSPSPSGAQADMCPLPTVNEEEAPSGMLARGHYNAVSSFVDDDKKEHLKFEWSFDISKDWE